MNDTTQTGNSKGNLVGDNRGLSITVDYVLGILILVILASALTIGLSDATQIRQESTEQQELERIGNEVASAIVSTANLANTAENEYAISGATSGSPEVTTRVDLPPAIGRESYTVALSDDGTLALETTNARVTLQIDETDLPVGVEASATGGGDIVVTYDRDAAGDPISISGANQ